MLTNFDYDTRYWTPEVLRAAGKIAFWMDPSDGKSLTLNGSTVAQINDKSGSNWNAVQTTAANQPTLDASTFNRYSLSCDGSNDISQVASWYIANDSSGYLFNDVCWSPQLGLFCAVSTTGGVTSPDGINWTARSGAIGLGMCWSPELGLFCAVSTNDVRTSPDGITWTPRSISTANWSGVCWSPQLGIFCATATGGAYSVATSSDGITWINRTRTEDNNWYRVAWSPSLGLFCAISNDGTNRAMTSPDGITWSTSAIPSGTYYRIVWADELGLFVACTYAGSPQCATSPDGVNWTTRTTGVGTYALCWVPELSRLLSLAYSGANLTTSPDGINWTSHLTRVPTQNSSQVWTGIAWSPTLRRAVAVASQTGVSRIIYSEPAGILDFWPTQIDGKPFTIAYVCNASGAVEFGVTGNKADGTTSTVPARITTKNFVYGATTIASTGVPTSGKMLIMAQHDGVNTMQAFTNGVSWGTATQAIVTPTTGDLSFPYKPSGTAQAGNFGEIIILSTALTTTERWKLEGYLAHKWGMRDLLPDGHPYKTKPPVR